MVVHGFLVAVRVGMVTAARRQIKGVRRTAAFAGGDRVIAVDDGQGRTRSADRIVEVAAALCVTGIRG